MGGKKSKRRSTGKRSTKKKSNVLKLNGSKESDDISDIEIDEAFEEFILWSLREDKDDLTPKKFAKMNTRMAKKIVNGEITVETIWEKREDILSKLEARIQNIEFGEGIDHLLTGIKFGEGIDLLTGIKFDNEEYKYLFREQLELSISLNKDKCCNAPLIFYVYDTFHDAIQRWEMIERPIDLEDSLYFGKSKEKFTELFQNTVNDLVSSSFDSVSEQSKIAMLEKYYMHPYARAELCSTRSELFKDGILYAQHLIKSVLLLFEEMYRCWRCKQLYLEGEGTETKALICAGCKCATYCSRECQIKHWKEGGHKEYCKNVDEVWSSYEKRKKYVGRALLKERIFTKPIIIDGVEKECFLPPCESLDYLTCRSRKGDVTDESMGVYYQNIARLACGGKHILFGNDTISSQLEEKIRKRYEDVILELDHSSVPANNIIDMHVIADILQYKESDLTKEDIIMRSKDLSGDILSVDTFITLYICYMPFNFGIQCFTTTVNKNIVETSLLEELKLLHE
ncbi:hypothetical protein CTEN210_04316 [Chaetoceros tenuissimus]|uniref:MYND-type domain-containing protein n=1 Tax=Chaetoceros tenuissimus TaxID=426638 RepID=A0AAD3H2D7_9STRA|nr:hypothetical protein CTEN210_04316 [Chaetoceros tenuissimus]